MVHELILRLIKQNIYEDQIQIIDDLKRNGVTLTQSTLSRYFKRLGVSKKDGRYICSSGQGGKIVGILSILEAPPNLIIIKTMPGHANAVGFSIEEKKFSEIIGTIAGDDTLMVGVHPENLKKLMGKLLCS
jgi:transcriptional regulator of arginine metabolism